MPTRRRGNKPAKSRRIAGKPSATVMTKFGSKGRNVPMSGQTVRTVRREGLRLYEDGTYEDAKRVKGAPKPKVNVTNPAGKTLSVSSKSALTRSGGFNKPPAAATARKTLPPQAARSVTSKAPALNKRSARAS